MLRQFPAHYIKQNESVRVPERFVVIDSESRSSFADSSEIQSWRCGVAEYIRWTKTGNIIRERIEYTGLISMWRDIVDFCRPKRRTVVYAHNMPYDIRITGALHTLPRLGCSLVDMRLASQGSWSKWTGPTGTLLLCDSTSIFPCSLAIVGKSLGIGKIRLPKGDNLISWLARCSRDVEILSEAIIAYITWIRTGVAGNWQITGASQSWSCWRHSFYTHKVLVHDNPDALELERRAMWTGRAEAWKWGETSGRAIYDYDWRNSYPRIAYDCNIPTRLVGTSSVRNFDRLMRMSNHYAVLAEVEVTTTEPIVPALYEDRIIWPVGTFSTVLWDPELFLLAGGDANVQIRQVYLYRKEPALKAWAEWILNALHADDLDVPSWQKLVLKHWSRSTIGRFSMRYHSWEKFGTSTDSRVYTSVFYDADEDTTTELLQVGNDLFLRGEEMEIRDSCPQVTGYIMSEARRRLWDATKTIGQEYVLYVDTDSLLLDQRGHTIAKRLDVERTMRGLRLKRRFVGYKIYGPRALVVGNENRFAGLPRRAKKVAEDTFVGEAWRGLNRSIQVGEHDKVRVTTRRFTVRYNDKRRIRIDGGSTAPIDFQTGKAARGGRRTDNGNQGRKASLPSTLSGRDAQDARDRIANTEQHNHSGTVSALW